MKVFTQIYINVVVDFIRFNLNFIHKKDKFAFLRHFLAELGVTYALRPQLVGKRVVDYLLAIIEHISLALTVETL